jgi:phosphomannomutase
MIVSMYFDEHNPPHFHARYGKDSVAVEIRSLRVIEGRLPPRALGLMMEWASQHQEELLSNWQAAREDKPLSKINPLA